MILVSGHVYNKLALFKNNSTGHARPFLNYFSCRIQQLAYAHMYTYFYWHTHDFGLEYLDKYTHLFSMAF